jgi:hypothetical protein
MNKISFIEKAVASQYPDPNAAARELMDRLPEDLDETAKQHGAIMRRRKLKSAKDFIVALACYVIGFMSQRELAATFIHVANMSDQAWQKKLCAVYPGLTICCQKPCPSFQIRREKPMKESVLSCMTEP